MNPAISRRTSASCARAVPDNTESMNTSRIAFFIVNLHNLSVIFSVRAIALALELKNG
jgi:hypothetical protein